MSYDFKSELLSLIDNHDLISFDVFDTLIHRLASQAWSVPKLVEAQLKYHDLTKTYPMLGTSFANARRDAEHVSRKEREQEYGDTESNFEEIYDVLQESLGIPDDVILELQRLELTMEGEVLYADPLMQEMFNYALSQGKKVIIVSDMYLPYPLIGCLLEGCGYDLTGIHIYVSCDWRKNKYRGDLFGCITEKGRMLHIGDNEYSDYEMVSVIHGADGYHYNYRDYLPMMFSFETSLTQSLIEGAVTKLWLEGNIADNKLFGIQLYGPLLTGFLIWFLAKIEKKHYDRILFFARDGALFYRALAGYNLPPMDYVYISRAAATLPALYDLDLQKLPRMISGKEPRPVREWLKLYGLQNPQVLAGQIHAAGFKSEEDFVQGGDTRMNALLQKLVPLIGQASAVAREEAIKYLGNFSGQKLAIVDLGWFGSLQQNFTKIINAPAVDGYYFNLWNQHEYSRVSLHDNFYSYLRDHANELFADIPTLLQRGGVELLEDVLSSPEGSTLGYYEGEPILDDAAPNPFVEEIQEGALAFFETLAPLLKIIPLASLDFLDWTRPFFRLVEFPTSKEAEAFGELEHSGGAGSNHATSIAPKLDEVSRKDKQLYRLAMAAAYWEQGFKLRNKAIHDSN